MSAIRKTYLSDDADSLRVPMREVVLSTGDSVVLYDTSGPYTDPELKTDVQVGHPGVQAWLRSQPKVYINWNRCPGT